jgi:anti-anti-sigma factor
MLGVLIFDTLPVLIIGIAASLVLLLYRASRPHIAILGRDPGGTGRWSDLTRNPDNTDVPGIVVLRPESGLFFANADAIRTAVLDHVAEGTRAIVLDAETVPTIDVTATSMLVELAADLKQDGIELVLARDVGTVRELIQLGEEGDPIRTFPTVRAAVEALETSGD